MHADLRNGTAAPLLYTAIAVFLAYFVWRSWGKVSGVVLDVVISLFLALAIEPVVLLLVRHGWKRGVASAASLIGLGAVIVALLALFGNMFVQQAISMVKGLPGVYDEISRTVEQYTSFKLPEIQNLGSEIFNNIQTLLGHGLRRSGPEHHHGAVRVPARLADRGHGDLLPVAAGPKLRRSLCQWLGPVTQRRFLLGWTIVQDQISNFLFSRTIPGHDQRRVHGRVPRPDPRALLAAAGPVLRHRPPSSSRPSAPISAAHCRCCSPGDPTASCMRWACSCTSWSTSRSRT